jgi:hypothetical protein
VIIAALFSLLLSFLGLFGLAWGGFPQKDHSATIMAMFFPFALAFPLFAFAVGVSRLALYAIWAATPFPWFAVVATSLHGFRPGLIGFLDGVVLCAYPSIPLALLAALIQFGTHFYEFTYDSHWVRWKVATHETTN